MREGLFKELRVCSTELGIQDLVKFCTIQNYFLLVYEMWGGLKSEAASCSISRKGII